MNLTPPLDPAVLEQSIGLFRLSRMIFAAGSLRIAEHLSTGPLDIDALARAFAWQSLAIDGVAQAAALAALTGPQDWIEEAVAELGEMRPRAVEAANLSGVLRAEVPEAAAFVWAEVVTQRSPSQQPAQCVGSQSDEGGLQLQDAASRSSRVFIAITSVA